MNEFRFPNQVGPTVFGKVRNLYHIVKDGKEVILCEVTDRISAFDVVLPPEIPFKGAVLNLIAAHFMKATEDIIPNCLLSVPSPYYSIWRETTPFKIEVIVRAYNTGGIEKNYTSKGLPNPWGYDLRPDLKKNEKLDYLICTPTTKALKGHDEDISFEEIIKQGLATEEELSYIVGKSYELFQRGAEMADKLGLIIVDTKYEFGKKNGTIYLIDEVHTPDSSRYWYKDTYVESFEKGEDPKALSKEFVRQWLIEQGFNGNEGDTMPEFTDGFIQSISNRYIELYQKMGLKVQEIDLGCNVGLAYSAELGDCKNCTKNPYELVTLALEQIKL